VRHLRLVRRYERARNGADWARSGADVLAELLNGSHFNYVMLSPTGNPTALSKVLMTPKARGPEGGAGAPPPQTAQFQPQYQQPVQISPALQVQQQNAAAEQSAITAIRKTRMPTTTATRRLRKRRIKAKRCRPTRRRNSRRQGFELRNSC